MVFIFWLIKSSRWFDLLAALVSANARSKVPFVLRDDARSLSLNSLGNNTNKSIFSKDVL